MKKRYDWSAEIQKLNDSKKGVKIYHLSSPGVAQVTRVRLLDEWNNLFARTEGSSLVLSVVGEV